MRVTRTLSALTVAFGAVIGLSTPAHAASGPWLQVSAGGSHTCAISSGKSLYCWGNNSNGQTGNGTASGNQLPLHRVGATGVWTSITAGSGHTCGITNAKNLYCWGNNSNGQTGNGTAGGNQLPLHRVGATGVWTSVVTGGFHTCGITTAKNLYCWGNNSNGQTGNGTASGNQLPLHRVGATGVWTSITAGSGHTCGITNAKNLYCWGSNSNGQTGNGTASGNQLPLHRVGATGVWTSITAGLTHTCGITNAKNLYCWGNNGSGQTGNGTASGNQLPLHRVGATGVWTSSAAGGFHTCGITTAKNFYCWGYNEYGQTGKGIAGGNQLPLHRVGATGVWASIGAGSLHTCGITTAKNLYCWGSNDLGQIGTGAAGGTQLPLFRVL